MQLLKKISKVLGISFIFMGAVSTIAHADGERRNIVGMEIGNLTEDQKKETGFTGEGVYVSAVIENHPAAIASLEAGDIITKIDGNEVRDVSEAIGTLNYLEAGRRYDFEVHRGPAKGGPFIKKISILVENVEKKAIGKIG